MFQPVTPSFRLAAVFPVALALTLASTLASVASAQDMQTVTVGLSEYQFSPKTVTLTVGHPVQLNIQNQGGLDHSLLSEIPVSQVHYQKADNTRAEVQRYEANNVINADVGSGHTSVVTFTPVKAGTFEFFSEDEEALGLTGNFVVVAAGGQPTAPAAPASPAPTNLTVARDGQSLASQSAATQAMFNAVWGNRAAQQWAQEHNAALAR